MLAFLKGFSITKWLIASAAIVGVLALTIFRLMAAGAARERAEQLERRIEEAAKVRKIKDEVDSLGKDAARDRLFKDWSR